MSLGTFTFSKNITLKLLFCWHFYGFGSFEAIIIIFKEYGKYRKCSNCPIVVFFSVKVIIVSRYSCTAQQVKLVLSKFSCNFFFVLVLCFLWIFLWCCILREKSTDNVKYTNKLEYLAVFLFLFHDLVMLTTDSSTKLNE